MARSYPRGERAAGEAARRWEQRATDEDTASDLAALRARIAALEGREAEHARAELVQTALYRIAEAASSASDLQAFLRPAQLHDVLRDGRAGSARVATIGDAFHAARAALLDERERRTAI